MIIPITAPMTMPLNNSMLGGIGSFYSGTAPFNPSSLFTGGFTGGWYDPSDLSTMFQDGATQVTADGQPVFLILDKSQNLALGSNTATTGYTNSAFDTFSVVGTVLTFAETGSYGAGSTNNVKAIINVGDVIKVVINVTSITGSFSVILGTIGGVASYSNAAPISGTGTKTVYLISTLTGSNLAVGFITFSAMSAVVEVISYEKISGNHLTQATSANRPLYKTSGGYSWLEFDGINDNLSSSATVDLSASDKLTLFAGVYSSATTRTIVKSGNTGTDAGSFDFGPFNTGVVLYRKGSGSFGAREVSMTSNAPHVLTATLDLAGTTQATENPDIRRDTTQPSFTNYGAADSGTGNFGNRNLDVGFGQGLLNGRIYQLIVLGKTASGTEITNTETFINSKCGAY